MGFRVLGRGVFGMERDWVGEINKLKRPLVEFQPKFNWKKSKTQVLPTCSPGPLSEDAAVGHSTDRCRVPWRINRHIRMVVNSHGKIPRFFQNPPYVRAASRFGKVFFICSRLHGTRLVPRKPGKVQRTHRRSSFRGWRWRLVNGSMNPWPESSQLLKPVLLARFPKPGVQKTLKEMKSLGVAPDRVSFNSAIATGVKAPRAVVGSVFWSTCHRSPRAPPRYSLFFLRGWHPIQL